jgi:hypothetical protein
MCCSEFVAAALKEAKLAPEVDPNVTSPADVCCWRLYEDTYHQFRIDPTEIPQFNSIPIDHGTPAGDPNRWTGAFATWLDRLLRESGRSVPGKMQSWLDDLRKRFEQ